MQREIIYITQSSGYGGAETYLLDLASAAAKEAKVSVALPFREGNAKLREKLHERSIEVIELQQYRANYLGNFIIARKFLRRHKKALFHFSLTYPDSCRWLLLAASLLKLDYLITEHLVPPEPFRESLYFATTFLLFNPLKKIAYRRARQVISVSAKTREILVDSYGMPEEKIMVIYNGIDTDFREGGTIDTLALLSEFGIKPGDVVIGCIARLAKEKGHVFLLQALGQLVREFPSLKTILVGDGPLKDQLAGKVRNSGLSSAVRFAGHRNDVPALLKIMDIFVLPSLNEGFPFTILEAMAAAKPIVATRIAGIPEAVEDGVTGFLVPPQDVEQLYRRIRDLLNDVPRRTAMGEQGRKRVQEVFSREVMLRKTFSLYEDVQ